jgi:hypothetical protein
LYRRALAIKQARLGEEHPDAAVTRHNLAITCELQGRGHEALDHLHRALTVFERTQEADHPTRRVCRTRHDQLAACLDELVAR